MKIKNVLIAVAVLGAAYTAYYFAIRGKKTRKVKEGNWTFEVEELEPENK
jgi:hypothetical protein